MNYDEYVRDSRLRYENLADTVASIIRSAIAADQRAFRFQQITSRAKDPTSLKRKLTERGLTDNSSIEQEIKDLAGCRLVFYTNTDIDRFLNSRLISDNFVVDFDGSKIIALLERSVQPISFTLASTTSCR